jgi:hypothetical protein
LNFSKANEFKLIKGSHKRVKVVYLNNSMKEKYEKKLKFIKQIYDKQKE